MKIWIDITNSPHVQFFAGMVDGWIRSGHEVLITCRPLANTLELLPRYIRIPYRVVGTHYGGNRLAKAAGFGVRCAQLYTALLRDRPDVAISHSSFYSPVVAAMLGVRCIYLNDNEHAQGNRIAFRLAGTVMIPELMDTVPVQRKGLKVVRYPGLKEGIYLWRQASLLPIPRTKKRVFVRPEPRTAEYYRGPTDFLDDVLQNLQHEFEVVVFPRDAHQRAHYSQSKFGSTTIPLEPLAPSSIVSDCDLFIGAGGTMTREAAVLGVPTISVYKGDLLAVDKYLISIGRMIHRPRLRCGDVQEFLQSACYQGPSDLLLAKGREAHSLINSFVLTGCPDMEVCTC